MKNLLGVRGSQKGMQNMTEQSNYITKVWKSPSKGVRKKKRIDLSNSTNESSLYDPHTWLDKVFCSVFYHGGTGYQLWNDYTFILNWTIKWMDGGEWEPETLLLQWEFMDSKERSECSKGLESETLVWIHVSLITEKLLHVYRYGYTHGWIYPHIFPCSLIWEDLETTPPKWQAHLAPGSWFLTPFSNKRNQDSLEKWLILELKQKI